MVRAAYTHHKTMIDVLKAPLIVFTFYTRSGAFFIRNNPRPKGAENFWGHTEENIVPPYDGGWGVSQTPWNMLTGTCTFLTMVTPMHSTCEKRSPGKAFEPTAR